MSDIIVGSVGVQILPSAQDFAPKVRALLRGLSVPVKLVPDLEEARAKITAFTDERHTATVNVKADTGAAEAKIAALGGSARGASGGVSGLALTAGALAPALVPATAAVGGLVAALSSPVLAAGGGLAAYIGVAGVAVKKTEDVKKQIEQLSKQAETATNPATAKRYQAEATALINSLSGPQRALLLAQRTVGKAFDTLMKSSGPAIFTPMVTGLNLLSAVLPKVAPLIDAVSGALNTLLTRVSAAVSSGAFDKQVAFFSKLAGPSIVGLATILGNIARGIGSIVEASAGLGGSLVSSLEKSSAAFAHIGQSKGFQSFLGYVAQVGPQVAHTLGAIADAGVRIAQGLAPLGGVALAGIQGIANAISSMDPGTITAIGVALLGLAAGMKAVAVATVLMDPVALGIAAVAGSLGLLYAKSSVFQGAVNDAFKSVLKTGIELVDWFKVNLLPTLANTAQVVGQNLAPVVSTLATVFKRDVVPAIQKVLAVAVPFLSALLETASAILGKVLPPFIQFQGFLYKTLANTLGIVAKLFLGFVGGMVDGAAKAFGWLPGVGGKLKEAAANFDAFRDRVNSTLSEIHDKTVTVTVVLNSKRISKHGAGNAALNAQHSGSYQIPKSNDADAAAADATAAAIAPATSSLYTAPSTTAADAAAAAKSAKAKAKLADNDSLLKGTKALKSAGNQLVNALQDGLKQGNGGLQKYLDKIKSSIGSKLASGDISKAAAKSMRQTVAAISKELKGVQAAYDNALTNLSGTGLNDLLQKKADLINSVKSAMSGELDLTQGIITTQPDSLGFGGGTSATFGSVSSVITGLAARLKTFAGQLTAMRNAGYPAELLQEVAGLGSQQGSIVAQALLSGSQAQITELSGVFGTITSSAAEIGQIVGDALYDPGIEAQKGILKGLLDDKGITDAGSKLAKKLTKAIRKALKIHSPSRLMAEQVGVPAGQGIGVGTLSAVDAWVPDVAARMADIQPAPYTGYGDAAAMVAASSLTQSDVERLADAISARPNILRMSDREATKLVLAGSSSAFGTDLRSPTVAPQPQSLSQAQVVEIVKRVVAGTA